jgi:hypothetical protein
MPNFHELLSPIHSHNFPFPFKNQTHSRVSLFAEIAHRERNQWYRERPRAAFGFEPPGAPYPSERSEAGGRS